MKSKIDYLESLLLRRNHHENEHYAEIIKKLNSVVLEKNSLELEL